MLGDFHPWIVELYDSDNPGGADHEYFRALAHRVGARRILDLGCGTGLLTRSLAEDGRRVFGIDPSAAMIAFAASRDEGQRVEWINGDSTAVPAERFDLAIMSGNVAQHISDPDWQGTLLDVRAALRTGGVLAFESRNPSARAWETWSQPEATTRMTGHGPLEEWADVDDLGEGRIHVRFSNRFVDTDEVLVEDETFVFRTRETLEAQLTAAGFTVTEVWGSWSRRPFVGTDPLFIVEAQAV
ncbi:class I SAM-dependent methyltransferase [Brevibacterium sanguinis]|uniref:class I SAM-dependent methyltransferase n=1 Tax=Brevibacterium sanguinis TaxID=232444 RepID=UPI0031D78DB0